MVEKINMNTLTYFSADTYNCAAYGQYAYETCGPNDNAGSDGTLANTGYDVLLPIALGASILIASVILLVKKARRKS